MAGQVSFLDGLFAAVRLDWLKDHNGVRTGLGPRDIELYEVTLTVGIELGDFGKFRVEYRHDWASRGHPFPDSRPAVFPGDGERDQGTISCELAFYLP